MNAKSTRYSGKGWASVAAVCAAGLAFFSAEQTSSAQIKSPGAHPHYSVEVDPHLVLGYTDQYWGHKNGWGAGARFSVPIVEQGPISKINNSMAIGFGVDWVHFSDYCWGDWWHGAYYAPYANEKCTANTLWFPVVLQWNFWLTKVISVFGEPGLAVVHRSWDFWWANNNCPNGACKGSESDTTIEPFAFFAGARFLFSDSAGLTIRLGWPYASVGASLLF